MKDLSILMAMLTVGCGDKENTTELVNECTLSYDPIGSGELIGGFAWVDWIDVFPFEDISGQTGIIWANDALGCLHWSFTPDDTAPITYVVGSNAANPDALCPEYSFMKGTVSLESDALENGDIEFQEQFVVQIRKSYIAGDPSNLFIEKEVAGIAGDADLSNDAISALWELEWFNESLSGMISANLSDGRKTVLAEFGGDCPEN